MNVVLKCKLNNKNNEKKNFKAIVNFFKIVKKIFSKTYTTGTKTNSDDIN